MAIYVSLKNALLDVYPYIGLELQNFNRASSIFLILRLALLSNILCRGVLGRQTELPKVFGKFGLC
jgi:hypothetical protein